MYTKENDTKIYHITTLMEQNSPSHTLADWICAAEFYNQQIRSKRIYPSEVLSSSKQPHISGLPQCTPTQHEQLSRKMKGRNERVQFKPNLLVVIHHQLQQSRIYVHHARSTRTPTHMSQQIECKLKKVNTN